MRFGRPASAIAQTTLLTWRILEDSSSRRSLARSQRARRPRTLETAVSGKPESVHGRHRYRARGPDHAQFFAASSSHRSRATILELYRQDDSAEVYSAC